MRYALLLGLVLFLAACGSSETPAPVARAAPVITPEVAAAPGRLHLTDGRVLPAERWQEDGDLLVYEWKGERQMLPRANVARIEGQSRPREVVVGSAQTQSTLAPVVVPKDVGPASSVDPADSYQSRVRAYQCGRPEIGSAASSMDPYLICVQRYGLTYTRTQDGERVRWELRAQDGRLIEAFEARGIRITQATYP
jgi:hypothetical protein